MLSRQEIMNRIYKVVEDKIDKLPNNLTLKEDINLEEDLNLDSLDKIELWLGIEEEFVVDIPDEEVKKLITFKDAIDLVIKYMEKKEC